MFMYVAIYMDTFNKIMWLCFTVYYYRRSMWYILSYIRNNEVEWLNLFLCKVGLGTAPCSGSISCKSGVNLYCDTSATIPSCICTLPWTLDVTYTSGTYLTCICTGLYHTVGSSCRNSLIFDFLSNYNTLINKKN